MRCLSALVKSSNAPRFDLVEIRCSAVLRCGRPADEKKRVSTLPARMLPYHHSFSHPRTAATVFFQQLLHPLLKAAAAVEGAKEKGGSSVVNISSIASVSAVKTGDGTALFIDNRDSCELYIVWDKVLVYRNMTAKARPSETLQPICFVLFVAIHKGLTGSKHMLVLSACK